MDESWTAIDFETANQDRGSACAVGLVRVAGGRIVDRYSTLIQPPRVVGFFSRRNVGVHGITSADVAAAPRWGEVLEVVLDFARGGRLVAHNAAFDMGVVRRACELSGLGWPALDYVCTLALSRRTWVDLPDHRLPTVCSRIGHQLGGRHHRADADSEAAAHIMVAAMRHHGAATVEELGRVSGVGFGQLRAGEGASVPVRAVPAEGDRFARWREAGQASLPQADSWADPAGPFHGRVVCVSGELESMGKPQAWKRIAEAGGHPAKNVTKRTDVLVAAGGAGAGRTAKHRRAETYRARGQRIEIITESEFLARLGVSG